MAQVRTGRKPGGQAGHPGTTLERTTAPDRIVEHRPAVCDGCGATLGEHLPSQAVEARQVFDLPPHIALEAVEHRLHTLACPDCGTATKATAPAGAARQAQYGPNIEAAAVYLANQHFVPLKRAAQLLADLFGAVISPATIQKMTAKAAAAIQAAFRPAARKLLLAAPAAHADETGFNVNGQTMWAHSLSSPQAAWIQVHPKRGRAAIDAIGPIPAFAGTLVHDAWAPYDTYPRIGHHQLCCAHLLRELQAVADQHGHAGGQWCWAGQTHRALTDLIHDPARLEETRADILSALACARGDPDPPGKLGRKHAALRRRIAQRLDDYLRFATTPGLPPTNNPAEQEIRMAKTKQKISGTMRTLDGANAFAAIRSYLSTARKHAVAPLDALASLTSPNPWLPTTP